MANEPIWRTLTETAILVGKSERTVLRRIESGIYRSNVVNGRTLVDCGDDGTPQAQVVAEVRNVAEDARRASALVAVALERITQADRSIIVRLEEEASTAIRGKRISNLVAILAVGLVIGLSITLATYVERTRQLSDIVSDMRTKQANHVQQATNDEVPMSAQCLPDAW